MRHVERRPAARNSTAPRAESAGDCSGRTRLSSLLKDFHRGHSERSEGGKAGGTKSRNPVEGPGEVAAKAGLCLLREPFVIRRGSSTARRATFARRGAPLGMTRERVFQQTAN